MQNEMAAPSTPKRTQLRLVEGRVYHIQIRNFPLIQYSGTCNCQHCSVIILLYFIAVEDSVYAEVTRVLTHKCQLLAAFNL